MDKEIKIKAKKPKITYGEVIFYQNYEKAVEGKSYVFSNSLFVIAEYPELCTVSTLSEIERDSYGNIYFHDSSYCSHTFIREIIKEQ